ncbi:membrane protein [Ralstonia solanacearum]|uniref:cell envelope integrity protein CreD n=1 Tax=Ralstonia solanacearum TaxID=305 RepID=UPI0007D78D46|nr:cell envelope integrity protein CreD [Ralstonia solanacearum]OAI61065.1 membrane protein [Ralstonia solanacearum]
MNRALLHKSLITGLLILLILIPLQMVNGLVRERSNYRDEAEQSIWKSYAGPQTLTGPIVVLPYKEIFVAPHANAAQKGQPRPVPKSVERQLLVFPKALHVNAEVTPSERYRGIHKTLVYEMQSRWEGMIVLPDRRDPELLKGLQHSAGHVRFELGKPYVVLGIADPRGLISAPQLELDGKRLTLEQGTLLDKMPQGLHAALGPSSVDTPDSGERVVPFSLTLPLLGAQSLAFTPVADENDIALNSQWPHPSFDGSFLPRTRTVDARGFHGNWKVTAFNTNARTQLETSGEHLDVISVKLIEPINVYLQAERAVKYGLLFVLLTFAGFFMFELVKQLRIHPIQYLLVGLALALFFLLLLSLSEHLAFWQAYLGASVACIGLLGFYLSFVLQSWKRGSTFATLLSALYGALYGLLLSEDNALVLGSMLLFVILAAIMVLTRRIDWYEAGTALQPPDMAAAARKPDPSSMWT